MVLNALVFASFLCISANVFTGVSTCYQHAQLKTFFIRRVKAHAGSCLIIPCRFDVLQTSLDGKLSGLWIKSPTSSQQSKHSIEIIGNLKENNCTTIFSDLSTNYAEYHFRIQSKNYNATAVCEALRITVVDSPLKPQLSVSGELKENQSVTLTCSAYTPCPQEPPKLSWSFIDKFQTTVDKTTHQTLVTKLHKTITVSYKNDGLLVKCLAEYPVKNTQVVTAEGRLRVSYSPKDTFVSIHPSAVVPAGSSVNLTCHSTANPAVTQFTWFQTSSGGSIIVSHGQVHVVPTVTHTVVLYCLATNGIGVGRSANIQLSVSDHTTTYGIIGGGIIAFLMLVCLVICVWKPQFRVCTCKNMRPRAKVPGDSASNQHESREDVLYTEINFSGRNLDQPAAPEDGGQQQGTVYAEVHVPRSSTGTTGTDLPAIIYSALKN